MGKSEKVQDCGFFILFPIRPCNSFWLANIALRNYPVLFVICASPTIPQAPEGCETESHN